MAHSPSTPPSEQPERRLGGWSSTFAALSYTNYRRLWITTGFSSAGQWIQQVTLTWLAYEVTDSPVKVAIVLGLRTLPMLTAPMSGVLADRFDRRKLLIIDHIALMVVAIAFSVDILLGLLQEWHLYVFAFLSGAAWSMNNPVRQALVANSVPRESLSNAIALNSMAFNSMRMIGPMTGGLLIWFFGPGWNFMIQALMYVGVLIAFWPYRSDYAEVRPPKAPQSVFRDLGEGFRYVAKTPITLGAIGLTLIATFTMMAFLTTQIAVYAKEVIGGGVDEGNLTGYLLTAMGLGGFVGTIIMARFARFRRKGLVSIFGIVSAGLMLMLLSQVDELWMALVVLAVQQTFFMSVMMSNNTIVQSTTPDAMRGRVMGVYMLDIGFQPLGGIIAGFVVAWTSVSTAWFVGGAAAIVSVAIVAVAMPSLRRVTV